MDIECVSSARAALGECPVWDGRIDVLWWLDIDSRNIHRYNPASATNETRTLPGRPGSLALTANPDRLLVAMEHQLVEFTWTSGQTTSLVEVEAEDRATRLNDGRTDPQGRFWVGSMDDPSGSGAMAGSLHRIDTQQTAAVLRTGIGVSNSLAFSPDGTTMYWSDTTRLIVWAYDYDVDTGTQTNERPFIDFAQLAGKPDGACVDETGCLWVAAVYGWSVVRVTPDGVVDRVVDLPVEKPSMPAFGGPDLSTIYVTSISSGGSQPAAPGQPLAGSLLAFDPGCRGIAEPVFAGSLLGG